MVVSRTNQMLPVAVLYHRLHQSFRRPNGADVLEAQIVAHQVAAFQRLCGTTHQDDIDFSALRHERLHHVVACQRRGVAAVVRGSEEAYVSGIVVMVAEGDQSAVGRDQHHAVVCARDASHVGEGAIGVVAQGVAGIDEADVRSLFVHKVDAASEGGHPQPPFAVLMQVVDAVVAQAPASLALCAKCLTAPWSMQ